MITAEMLYCCLVLLDYNQYQNYYNEEYWQVVLYQGIWNVVTMKLLAVPKTGIVLWNGTIY